MYGWDASLKVVKEYSRSSWWLPTIEGRAAQGWGQLDPPSRVWSPPSTWSPMVSSRTFLCIHDEMIPRSLLIFRSSLVIFYINPVENIDSPKPIETISNNLLLYSIYQFWSFMEERLMVHGILYLPSISSPTHRLLIVLEKRMDYLRHNSITKHQHKTIPSHACTARFKVSTMKL
jgi:hypothetical protein